MIQVPEACNCNMRTYIRNILACVPNRERRAHHMRLQADLGAGIATQAVPSVFLSGRNLVAKWCFTVPIMIANHRTHSTTQRPTMERKCAGAWDTTCCSTVSQNKDMEKWTSAKKKVSFAEFPNVGAWMRQAWRPELTARKQPAKLRKARTPRRFGVPTHI